MRWYGVRTVYEHARGEDGTVVFGERIILLQANSDEDLIRQAEDHWAQCVELNPGFKRLGNFAAFAINSSEPLTNGTEVWCELQEGKVSPEEFYNSRYEQFAIKPGGSDA